MAQPPPPGLYDPRFEHDACGLAALARLDGRPAHELVERALHALVNLDHRGATGADPETGDGAGIMTQLPHRFLETAFREAVGHDLPPAGSYATGLVFLPRDPSARPTPPTRRSPLATWQEWPFLLRTHPVHEEGGRREWEVEPTAIAGAAAP